MGGSMARDYLKEVQEGTRLRDVPFEERSDEVCRAALEMNPMQISHVPDSLFVSHSFSTFAIELTPYALRKMPEEMKTSEICLDALKRGGGSLLAAVPEDLRSREICDIAVSRGFVESISDCIPEAVMADQLAEGKYRLWEVKASDRTPSVCLAAVQADSWQIRSVPPEHLTPEICETAVEGFGGLLEEIPEHLRTNELSAKAVENDELALRFVPEEHKNADLCAKAVEKNPAALEYVPEELKSKELCMEAVRSNGLVLSFVPEGLRSSEIYEEAVRNNGQALKSVPEDARTKALCLMAAANDARALSFVPNDCKTPEVLLAAANSRYAGEQYGISHSLDLVKQGLPEDIKRICEQNRDVIDRFVMASAEAQKSGLRTSVLYLDTGTGGLSFQNSLISEADQRDATQKEQNVRILDSRALPGSRSYETLQEATELAIAKVALEKSIEQSRTREQERHLVIRLRNRKVYRDVESILNGPDEFGLLSPEKCTPEYLAREQLNMDTEKVMRENRAVLADYIKDLKNEDGVACSLCLDRDDGRLFVSVDLGESEDMGNSIVLDNRLMRDREMSEDQRLSEIREAVRNGLSEQKQLEQQRVEEQTQHQEKSRSRGR